MADEVRGYSQKRSPGFSSEKWSRGLGNKENGNIEATNKSLSVVKGSSPELQRKELFQVFLPPKEDPGLFSSCESEKRDKEKDKKISEIYSSSCLYHEEKVIFMRVLKEFYHAVNEGKGDTIEEIVHKYNIDVNYVFHENLTYVKRKHRGWSSIHIAASHSDLRAVNWLLKEGCDVDGITPEGETPLHIAAKQGAADIVSALLECNIFLRDRQNNQGATALLKSIINCKYAFTGNYRRCVDILLAAGSHPNISSSSGVTALHAAVDKGDPELVVKLINAYANVNAVCDLDTSPLHRALTSRIVKSEIIIPLLEAGADITRLVYGRYMLHIAVSRCDDQVITLFLQHGANPNFKDQTNKTPLWMAVEENNTKLVPVLVQGGGNINFKYHEISLLSYAVENNMLAMVKVLLQLGAETDTDSFVFPTPLHFAVHQQNLDIVMELIKFNTPVSRVTYARFLYGPMSPIQLALELGLVEIVCLLMQVGAEVKWAWLKEENLSIKMALKPDAVRHIKKYLREVPSLSHICRLKVRSYLGSRFTNAMQEITSDALIPLKVSKYLALSDVLD